MTLIARSEPTFEVGDEVLLKRLYYPAAAYTVCVVEKRTNHGYVLSVPSHPLSSLRLTVGPDDVKAAWPACEHCGTPLAHNQGDARWYESPFIWRDGNGDVECPAAGSSRSDAWVPAHHRPA